MKLKAITIGVLGAGAMAAHAVVPAFCDTNVPITGTGTAGDPWVISCSAFGGNPANAVHAVETIPGAGNTPNGPNDPGGWGYPTPGGQGTDYVGVGRLGSVTFTGVGSIEITGIQLLDYDWNGGLVEDVYVDGVEELNTAGGPQPNILATPGPLVAATTPGVNNSVTVDFPALGATFPPPSQVGVVLVLPEVIPEPSTGLLGLLGAGMLLVRRRRS